MDFKVMLKNGEHEYRSIELKTIKDGNYSEDFFADNETDVEYLPVDDQNCAYVVSEDEYEELTDFYRGVVEGANNGYDTGIYIDNLREYYDRNKHGELILIAN